MNGQPVRIRKLRNEEDRPYPKGTWYQRDSRLIVICPRCGAAWDLTDAWIDERGVTNLISHGKGTGLNCTYEAALQLVDFQ